jgi:DNA-binding PadR family transcriptional regulator
MSETYKKEIVQHIIRNLLDIQLLETDFNLKLRHGSLYPSLRALEKKGLVESAMQQEGGRVRKVYAITASGKIYLQTYYGILRSQLENV